MKSKLLMLFSVYFLFLAACPCTDHITSLSDQTQVSNKQHCETGESCAPFCCCSCCSVPVEAFVNNIFEFSQASISTAYRIHGKFNLPLISSGFWQPPKLA